MVISRWPCSRVLLSSAIAVNANGLLAAQVLGDIHRSACPKLVGECGMVALALRLCNKANLAQTCLLRRGHGLRHALVADRAVAANV